MNFRPLGASGLTVSEVGLGCEHLQGKELSDIRRVIDAAVSGGVNILDVFMSEPEVRANIGIALKGKRDKVLLQGHIGAGWVDGQYCRTREPARYRHFFEDFMARLQTDTVDIGMLHFVDTRADFDQALANGMLDYACELKAKGVLRATGVSSHDPLVAQQLVETGKIDVLMFSLNPAYDTLPPETDVDGLFKPESYQRDSFTIVPERLRLYQTCEALGVGITVMKALGAGALLRAESSPYGAAMTVPQCIHYALTRPAVASVLVGCKTAEEVEQALAYAQADDQARDYAATLAESPKFSLAGKCMYCNHCLPCPSHIDIARVNKFLDLAAMDEKVPETVGAHYAALACSASDCIKCGQCEKRCPFGVPVAERMAKAAEVFGR
ncbi:MAG: aldo/keto reductase [Firmicutes bacterium]|nr:aldo/keto reductase [Bacillota bacterium]